MSSKGVKNNAASVRQRLLNRARSMGVTGQKKLNLFLIPPTGFMPSSQPVGQLFRITAHLGPKFFEGQSVNLFVPGKSFQRVFGAGDGIVAKEGDDPGKMTPVNSPPMLPVPDCGGRDAYFRRHVFLI